MITRKAKYLLITLAKILPFIFCLVVCVSYLESFFSLIAHDFSINDSYLVLKTPLSWFVATIYTYGWYTILALVILAIAMETCIWNRLAILYLALHLVFKQFIEQIELYEYQVYILCLVNITISTILIMKGLKIRKGGIIING